MALGLWRAFLWALTANHTMACDGASVRSRYSASSSALRLIIVAPFATSRSASRAFEMAGIATPSLIFSTPTAPPRPAPGVAHRPPDRSRPQFAQTPPGGRFHGELTYSNNADGSHSYLLSERRSRYPGGVTSSLVDFAPGAL